MTGSSFQHPVPLSGWRALRRWLACKLGHQRGMTCEQWETDEIRPGVRRHTVTAWCGECGRPLKEAERALCQDCGQPVRSRQIPRDHALPTPSATGP